jgi:hypothetical protein
VITEVSTRPRSSETFPDKLNAKENKPRKGRANMFTPVDRTVLGTVYLTKWATATENT